MTLREAWTTEVEIKLYQLIAVLLALLVTWAGGIYGLWRYSEDRAVDELRDDIALCEQRVVSRDDLRGVLLALFNLIDDNGDGSLAFVIEARRILDDGYPALDIADCSMEG